MYEKMVQDQRTTPIHIIHYDQIIMATKSKYLQKASKTKRAEESKKILKWPRQEELVVEMCHVI